MQRWGSIVTARVYIEILRNYLQTILGLHYIFIEDNVPIYKPHKIRDFLVVEGQLWMIWSLYSPYLDPIGNIWNMSEAEFDGAHPELMCMGYSNAARDFVVEFAQEACEVLKSGLLNDLAGGY